MAQQEDGNNGGTIKDTIDAATGLVKAIPIYDDAIQPAAKEIGKSLGTVAKLVNVALAPVGALVWGYEKLEEFVNNRVAKKLENTPEEKIITPDPAVVGPALEALRYTGSNEILSEMFANLIANAMDEDTVKNAHPGFIEIIKNLTSDEGLILKVFQHPIPKPMIDFRIRLEKGQSNLIENYSKIGEEAGCKHLDLVPSYINNLCRLGLLQIPSRYLIKPERYDNLIKSDYTAEFIEYFKKNYPENAMVINKKYIELTSLGIQFQAACVIDKAKHVKV